MTSDGYDENSTESGSGTPEGEQAANQPDGQSEAGRREVASLQASGTVTSGDPQAASPARISREADLGGSGVHGLGATPMAQGQTDPPTPPEGVGQPELGVTDAAAGGVPSDPGRKLGATTHSEVVGACRPHAPDGEVSPS